MVSQASWSELRRLTIFNKEQSSCCLFDGCFRANKLKVVAGSANGNVWSLALEVGGGLRVEAQVDKVQPG